MEMAPYDDERFNLPRRYTNFRHIWTKYLPNRYSKNYIKIYILKNGMHEDIDKSTIRVGDF